MSNEFFLHKPVTMLLYGKNKPNPAKRKMRRSSSKSVPILKQNIIDHILDHIIGGAWPPGHRLPTRVEFEKMFSTTAVTVNRAFEPLIRDGFLRTAGKSGTFVSANPPHLNNFAIVYPDLIGEENNDSSALYDAMRLAEDKVAQELKIKLVEYDKFSVSSDCRSFLKLTDDIVNHRLAGVFFSHWPRGLEKSSFLDILDIPSVTLCSTPRPRKVFSLNTILDPVLDHAIEYFASCGCRQAALLCVPFYHAKLENFRKKFAAAGIELKSENIQFSNPDYSWTASHCARLLFSESRQSFPDSLFIVDDNLVKPALNGMLEAASRNKIDAVKIACLANFPNELSFKLPVAQFGYDMTAVFHQVLDLLMSPESRASAPKHQDIDQSGYRCLLP